MSFCHITRRKRTKILIVIKYIRKVINVANITIIKAIKFGFYINKRTIVFKTDINAFKVI